MVEPQALSVVPTTVSMPHVLIKASQRLYNQKQSIVASAEQTIQAVIWQQPNQLRNIGYPFSAAMLHQTRLSCDGCSKFCHRRWTYASRQTRNLTSKQDQVPQAYSCAPTTPGISASESF